MFQMISREQGATTDELWNTLYGNDPEGGPLSPNIIAAQIRCMNMQLKEQHQCIVNANPKTVGRGNYARYKLTRTE